MWISMFFSWKIISIFIVDNQRFFKHDRVKGVVMPSPSHLQLKIHFLNTSPQTETKTYVFLTPSSRKIISLASALFICIIKNFCDWSVNDSNLFCIKRQLISQNQTQKIRDIKKGSHETCFLWNIPISLSTCISDPQLIYM